MQMMQCLRLIAAATSRRFKRDANGNVAVTMGLCFLPALLMAGSAIDYSRSVTRWSNLQQATDSTALTISHAYLTQGVTGAALTGYAQSYLNGLMMGAKLTGAPLLQQSNTVVCLSASYVVPTVFMKIARINSLTVSTTSCSQVGQTYEVALALDNSGSMANAGTDGTRKIDALKTAAKQLVSILIPNGSVAPQVGIALVPFTSMVNVGSSTSAAFLDRAGASSIHWQNFHRPAGTTYHPTWKVDLFSSLGTTWGGCVEERPYPYVTTDTAASTATPDTMFVPYLAPDEPGAAVSSSGKTPGYSCYPADCSANAYVNSYLTDNGTASQGTGTCSTSGSYASADNAATFSGDGQTNIYPGSGMTMVCKYDHASVSSANSYFSIPIGPNYMCSSQQMSPLTTSATSLNTSIDAMAANGSTDLAAGFMWAWRAISPVVNPFPTTSVAAIGPQNPKSYTYGPPANQKIIILMTDGTNSWTPSYDTKFRSLYEAFGYFANNRLSNYATSSLNPTNGNCSNYSTVATYTRCQLDNVTLEACNNAKNSAGRIIVFTIGVSVPGGDTIDDQGVNVLKTCASSPSSSHYFPVSDSASMQSAFRQIAATILSLRLTQ